MRRLVSPLLAVATAALVTTCTDGIGSDPTPEPIIDLPRDLSVAEGKLIEADNRFALKLFSQINEQEFLDLNRDYFDAEVARNTGESRWPRRFNGTIVTRSLLACRMRRGTGCERLLREPTSRLRVTPESQEA
jgi:hypothetical protein